MAQMEALLPSSSPTTITAARLTVVVMAITITTIIAVAATKTLLANSCSRITSAWLTVG